MSDFENDLQRLTFLKRTIALLSSMVDSGERHTARSKEMKNNAQQVILEMEANVVKTSDSNCNIPLVSISLRDFFAAEAMKAECISWNAEMSDEYRAKILEDMIERWGETTVYEAIALNSYEMSDNMLKAKSRNEC